MYNSFQELRAQMLRRQGLYFFVTVHATGQTVIFSVN